MELIFDLNGKQHELPINVNSYDVIYSLSDGLLIMRDNKKKVLLSIECKPGGMLDGKYIFDVNRKLDIEKVLSEFN